MKKTFSRALSVFLAVVMLAVSVPAAFAATALKATMVTEWPTATGEMYYGQIVSENITLSGGRVEYNGTEIPGKFVHYKDDFRPLNASDAYKANLKFVPDDSSAYTGFNKLMSADVTFPVKKTTPVWIDESDLPIATSVKSGQTLSESTISGGTMKNPYNENETGVQAAVWTWSNPNTVLTESGEYEAYYAANEKNYEILKRNIYVEVEQDVFLTEISVIPTINEFSYNPEITWEEVSLSGGIAVVSGTNTQVEGEFTLTDTWKSRVPWAGSYEISAVFTPYDAEKYTTAETRIPVTVNKATMKFADKNGEEIVPEITLPYGTKFGDVSNYLEPYASGPDVISIGVGGDYKDTDVCKDGIYTAILVPRSDADNYEKTELPFKIVIERKKINPSLKASTEGMYIHDGSGTYRPTGTFTLEYTIDGVPQEPITGIKYNTKFDWNPTKSGTYVYTIIYNEAEVDEYFIIDDFTTSNPIALTWAFSATGMPAAATYKYGSAVSYTAPAIDETKSDKPYYVFSEWSEVKGIEMTDEQKSNPEVSFTMPDNDVELKASYKFSFKAFFEWILAQITQFFTFIVNAVKDLIALA